MSGDALTTEGLVLSEARGDVFVLDVAIGMARRRVLAKRSGRLDLGRGRITFRGTR